MRCFYHEDKEAVGTCKSCGRGLCRECAVELPKSLACRGRCEADAQAVTRLIDRNIQITTTSSRFGARYGAGIFYLVMGILFITWGLLNFERVGFIAILGFAFLAYGIYWLVLTRKMRSR
jgi:hypothetical protein